MVFINISFNFLSYSWKVVVPRKQLHCFESSKVSLRRIIVMSLDYPCYNDRKTYNRFSISDIVSPNIFFKRILDILFFWHIFFKYCSILFSIIIIITIILLFRLKKPFSFCHSILYNLSLYFFIILDLWLRVSTCYFFLIYIQFRINRMKIILII